MGQTTITTSIVTSTDTQNVPVEVTIFSSQYGLTVAQAQDVQHILAEHETNLPSVSKLLDEGLSIAEVGEVYDTRERLNTALASTLNAQRISLKAIVAFQREFPEIPLDADCLTDYMLQIQENLPAKYFNSALNAITEAGQRYDNCFAEVLAAFLNGNLEVTDE